MLLLRFAAVLMLVVWVGGLLALGGVAAPAIFDVAAARTCPTAGCWPAPSSARSSGAFTWSATRRDGAAARPWRLGDPRARDRAASPGAPALGLVMLAASAYSGLVVAPRIRQLQANRRRAVQPRGRRSAPRRVRPAARAVDRAAAGAAPRRADADLLGDQGMTDIDTSAAADAIRSAIAAHPNATPR